MEKDIFVKVPFLKEHCVPLRLLILANGPEGGSAQDNRQYCQML